LKDNEVIGGFLDEICALFPEVKVRMDLHEDDMTTYKMEEFATATTLAIASGQIELAKSYMDYMDRKLANANLKEFEFIDVYYVEHLFWNATDVTRQVGWPLVPAKLKQLYVQFYGKSAL
jgi:hypothetical protein